MLHFIYEASNVAIFVGYLFLATYLAPRLDVRYRQTRIGGAVFFLTCGLTHAGLLYSSHWLAHESVGGVGGGTVVWTVLHVIQAAAVWLFIGGLYREYLSVRSGHQLIPTVRESTDQPGR